MKLMVRFTSHPIKNKIPFLLPKAESVLELISKDIDEALFNDLLNSLNVFLSYQNINLFLHPILLF